MPKRGENIYKRKDKRWEGRYIREYNADGKARYGYVYAKSYRETKEKLMSAKMNPSNHSEPSEKLFGHYCEEWLHLSRNRVKESTFVKYHTILFRHIKPALGSVKPQQIDIMRVESFSNNLLEQGLSVKTVRDILTVLRSVFRYVRHCIGGALSEIDVIYPKEHKKEMRVLSLDEQQRFTRYLLSKSDSICFGMLLALLTGMRIGEICALRWSDLSLEERVVHVRLTMQRLQTLSEDDDHKTKIQIDSAKSDTSNRIIPLTDYAVALCRSMQPADPQAYILTGDAHRFLEPRVLQYHFKKHTAACGLNDVHFHTLRHTFATRCVEVGFEIKSLSEILGHASARITLDRYVHSSLELKRSNMEKLSVLGF